MFSFLHLLSPSHRNHISHFWALLPTQACLPSFLSSLLNMPLFLSESLEDGRMSQFWTKLSFLFCDGKTGLFSLLTTRVLILFTGMCKFSTDKIHIWAKLFLVNYHDQSHRDTSETTSSLSSWNTSRTNQTRHYHPPHHRGSFFRFISRHWHVHSLP